jgi:hypothetical protein
MAGTTAKTEIVVANLSYTSITAAIIIIIFFLER